MLSTSDGNRGLLACFRIFIDDDDDDEVVLVYLILYPFRCNLLLMCALQPKIAKNTKTPYFGGYS